MAAAAADETTINPIQRAYGEMMLEALERGLRMAAEDQRLNLLIRKQHWLGILPTEIKDIKIGDLIDGNVNLSDGAKGELPVVCRAFEELLGQANSEAADEGGDEGDAVMADSDAKEGNKEGEGEGAH